MIICLCQGVSDRTVRAAIGAGAASLDDVSSACSAGSDCGVCQATILDMLASARRAVAPVAAGVLA